MRGSKLALDDQTNLRRHCLKTDGTVAAFGNDAGGCLAVDRWNHIVAIAAGNYTSIGLRDDGFVVSAASNDNGETATDSWHDIVAVKAYGDITALQWALFG